MKFIYCLLLLVNFCYSYNYNKLLFTNRWYVIGRTETFAMNRPKQVIINNTPISVWKDAEGFSGIHDVCPHRGASLSKGRFDTTMNCVVCPYHTFKFNSTGRMVQTPGQVTSRQNSTYNARTDVPFYNIIAHQGWLFLQDTPIYDVKPGDIIKALDWIEPETMDITFRYVSIEKDFNTDARTVTENSLDILHISEVHTFGNRKRPLPISERIERNVHTGRTKAIYEYSSGDNSIAKKIFGINTLVVENEYILPHYTIARVKFGKFVNTVVTSALPINKTKTRLFVKVYRNNWVFDDPILNKIFDNITRSIMKKTLCEDQTVLESIDFSNREGNFITKYDELTRMYRADYANYMGELIDNTD